MFDAMNSLGLTLASGEEVLPIVAVGGGLLIAVIAIVSSAIRGIARERQQEKTKREIAAYIAEGSMTPDEGERLVRAAPPKEGA